MSPFNILSRFGSKPSSISDIIYFPEDNSVSSRASGTTSRTSGSAISTNSRTSIHPHMRSRAWRNVDTPSQTSMCSEFSKHDRVASEGRWNDHADDGGSSFSFLTFLYAVFMIIFLLIEETSLEEPPEHAHDFKISHVFSMYMYTTGIGFFVYVNLFVIYPSLINRILQSLSGKWRNAKKHLITPAAHDSEAVNSLYLRIGIVFFGTMGIVVFGLLLYLLFANEIHNVNVPTIVIETLLGIVFTFLQMLFMTVNYKVSIKSSKNICRFGFMHNFAVNIWTWHRFAIAKFNESIAMHAHRLEAREALIAARLSTTPDPMNYFAVAAHDTASSVSSNASIKAGQENIQLLEHFGEIAIFLSSCLIEYSVIGAAVMFVFWKHIDSPKQAESNHKETIDSNHSKRGLFLGVAVAIIGAVAAGVYQSLSEWPFRTFLFGGFDALCYILCTLAVVGAARCMRSMVSSSSHHGEDVDEILLYIAFMGEVVWCSAEITNYMSGRVNMTVGVVILNVSLIRLIHVFAQTWFILSASRMHMSSSTNKLAMRGREYVTFLLIVNITLFFFGIYESQYERFGFLDELSSSQLYMKLYAAPITVFYRFHSSVCLAEIWQKSFATPKITPTRVNSIHTVAQPHFTVVTID